MPARRKIKPFGVLIIIIALAACAVGIYCLVKSLMPQVSKKYIYPKTYSEYVEKYSQEYDLDPLYVYTVIKVESNFNPDAKSSAGASGLMQIMPVSFEEVAAKLGEEDTVTFEEYSNDPETNIRYGCFILRQLLDEFEQDFRVASAAYNGGIGNCQTWVEDGTISYDDFDAADIPLDETRHYVTKITETYEAYKNLYE